MYLAAGKAFHTATEKFDLSCENDPETIAIAVGYPLHWEDAFTDAFDAELEAGQVTQPDLAKWKAGGRRTKEKPNKEDVPFWHAYGRELMDLYIQWRADTCEKWEIATVPGKGLAIEIEVTSPVGGVPMKGYIDRVLRDRESGQLVVVDIKTGSRMPSSPMQLALYSVQVEELIAEPALWGAWYDARKGTLGEPIDLSVWTEGLLGHVYSNLDRAITAGIFLPNIDSHCTGCGVAKFCVYQGGREPIETEKAA